MVAYIHLSSTTKWPALADGGQPYISEVMDHLFDVQPDDAERPVDRPALNRSVNDLGDVVKLRNEQIDHARGVTAADLLVPALRRRLRHPALVVALLRAATGNARAGGRPDGHYGGFGDLPAAGG